MDIRIDVLRINLADAAGHEHRIRPIAARTTAILLESLSEGLDALEGDLPAGNTDFINPPPVSVDLNRMTDEQAAHRIAEAWLNVLALKLR